MIARELQNIILQKLKKGKTVILLGARQVGKTTLLKNIAVTPDEQALFFNCDEPDVRELFTNVSSTNLKLLIGRYKIVVIDEAQRIKNIGLTLKLIVDEMPDVRLLVSGSSALELANEVNEPLTGRKFEYYLYPFSFNELAKSHGLMEEKRALEDRLIYGSYPKVIVDYEERIEHLTNLASSYLYKDIFNFQDVRKPELLQILLEALALQIGSEVSYHELAGMVKTDAQTVARYIDLLEKTFVIFRIRAFSRNVRTELKKSRKIYFYDNGVRNALIRNFNPLRLRVDAGALWENYLISERMKRNANQLHYCNNYFWRTAQQQEIDYIEEYGGKLYAFEFKWNSKKSFNFSKLFFEHTQIMKQR
jgi:predicted AAA+ superfamily ATPase